MVCPENGTTVLTVLNGSRDPLTTFSGTIYPRSAPKHYDRLYTNIQTKWLLCLGTEFLDIRIVCTLTRLPYIGTTVGFSGGMVRGIAPGACKSRGSKYLPENRPCQQIGQDVYGAV